MDETKQTNQGTPQGTEPSSGGEGGITPPTKVYSEAEYRKAISDLKADFGRKEKELTKSLKETQVAKETIEKSFDSTSSRLEALEDRIRESELETIRDNPSQLKLYQEKDTLTKRLRDYEKKERELIVRETKVASIETEMQEAKKGSLLSLVANRVTPEKLEKLKSLSMEALEVMVDVIGKEPVASAPGFTPDSGISSGGIGELTVEQADKMSMEEYASRRKKQKEASLK